MKLSELPTMILDSALWRGVDGLPGEPGKQGLPGKDSTVAGPAGEDGKSFTFCGPWRAAATYGPNDVVSLEGSSYVCTSPSHNNRPHSTSRVWQLLAARGERGARGEAGFAGQRGRRGLPGEPGTGGGGGEPIAFIADSDITAGQPLIVTTAGHCTLGDATTLATSKVVGLATINVPSGVAGIMQAGDTLTLHDWTAVVGSTTLTPGSAYFLSTTVGMLSVSPPGQVSGVCAVFVGRALSDSEFLIEVANPIVRSEP